MAEWIDIPIHRDRPPTEADADSDGDVLVQYKPDSRPENNWKFQHYSLVVKGQKWLSPNDLAAANQAAEPAAAAGKPGLRKVVQIAILPGLPVKEEKLIISSCLLALCSDDTIWFLPLSSEITPKDWCQLPPIPQPDPQ